jgi:Protein of unknown function (DUF3048) N-terminal domain/Protein of unknown function (DUF3048) C-terminal domain
MKHRIVAILAITAVAAAACSGDEKAAETSPPSTAKPTTTSKATTTTKASTTTAAETTTTVAPDPVYPLTGELVDDEGIAARPALVVKIDNNPSARPQTGLNQADIVFEEIVEYGTRFAAVFQTQIPDPVGPIRSGRTQDIAMLGSYNSPLFAWSGGNGRVTAAIEGSDLVNLSAQRNDVSGPAGFYRDKSRKAPHNLYAQGSGLYSLTPFGAGPPKQQFDYFEEGDANPGTPAIGVDLSMDIQDVGWRYDEATGDYLRTNDGKPHNDTSGQVNAKNVVVLVVEYIPSPADARSPEAQTLGAGEVLVYTGGTEQVGTWTREDRAEPFKLTDANGNPIELTPGRTWVELAKPGTFAGVES